MSAAPYSAPPPAAPQVDIGPQLQDYANNFHGLTGVLGAGNTDPFSVSGHLAPGQIDMSSNRVGTSDGGSSPWDPVGNPGTITPGVGLMGAVPSSGPTAPKPPAPYMTDPGYVNATALEQLGISQTDAGLKAARERAIIQFGDPSLAAFAGFGLDPQAAAFARQNYLSGDATLARIDKNREAQRRAVINRLAGHGLLNSGDLGYGIGEADTSYGNQVYDARQSVLDYLSGLTQQNLNQKLGLHQSVNDAISTAFQRFLDHPDAYAPPDATTPPDGSTASPPPAQRRTAAVAKRLAKPTVVRPDNRAGRRGV